MTAIGMASDKGPVRKVNQDACCALVAQTGVGDIAMAVVCDGVGGLAHGEVASAHVVHGFATWFKTELGLLSERPYVAGDLIPSVEPAWRDLLSSLNAHIKAEGDRISEGLATTCTAVLVCEGAFVAAQVGDSRLYALGWRGCRQITHDQTLVSKLVSEGKITEQEAVAHPQRTMILEAVGARDHVEPEFYRGELDPGDVLLLCSDGACRCMGSADVMQLFCAPHVGGADGLDVACHQYLARCLEEGETDNLTVVCVAPEVAPVGGGDTVVIGRDAA